MKDAPVVCEASIPCDAADLCARMVAHLNEHEIAFELRDSCLEVELGRGFAKMTAGCGALDIRLKAADRGDLEMLREGVATLVAHLASEPVLIRWSGLVGDGETFTSFREIRLLSIAAITPHMRRLTFAGAHLERFASPDDLHVRLYFPPPGVARAEWPRPGPDGRTRWPPEDRRPAARYYTVRSIDAAEGTIVIDFVLHADAGPGSAFAETARPGAVLGMMGPLGRTAAPAAWHLLAGDETALPAIARILKGLPRTARGVVLIEVSEVADEVPLGAPSGMAVRWLHRNGAAAGSPDLLAPAVRAISWPEEADVFAWIGCEFGLAKTLRRHLGKERGLTRDRFLVVGYWSRPPA